MTGVVCTTCKHLRQLKDRKDPLSCDAFPDGIPLTILNGSNDHRLPIEGDHDLQWEPKPGWEWMDVPATLVKEAQGNTYEEE